MKTTKQISFTKEKLEQTWDMFTADGQPVYVYGCCGFTLEQYSGPMRRQQHRFYQDGTAEQRQRRLDKAKAKLGVECEWREGEKIRSFGVIF